MEQGGTTMMALALVRRTVVLETLFALIALCQEDV